MLESLDINTVISAVINGGLGLAALRLAQKLGITVDLLTKRVDQHDDDIDRLRKGA